MSEIKQVPARSEIPQQYTWNTADIYPTDQAWQEAYDALMARLPEAAAYAGRLGESGAVLYAYQLLSMEIYKALDRLYEYADRKYDQDTTDPVYQAMAGKMGPLSTAVSKAMAFETPEFIAISDETMERLYAEEPRLELYRLSFDRRRERRAHILSDAEERLMAATGELTDLPEGAFSKLANADLTFADAVDSEGVAHPVSNSSYGLSMESEDRVLRKSAFESMYAAFGGVKNVSAALLAGQIKQLKFTADARNYPDALTAAVSRTRVPPTVYRNLIATVNANLDKLHRYIRLRKKLLGVEELHMYDIYAPIVHGVDMVIPYQQAQDTVYEALAPLGEDYRRILREGFDNRWIDVYENKGKYAGAYSAAGGWGLHPFVLLNHKDNLDSMFTLAHEMGHALHSYLSSHNQPDVYQHYMIFVAEVASTCNEALLMEYLLARTADKKERAYILGHFLEQFKGTLYRQTQFAEFELWMNEQVAKGEALTADSLCREYLALNKKYYGPDMVSDEEIALEWARIPHFYMNYYVYQYATGYSAAIALSRRILKEGEPAVKDYLGFLSGGSSKDPIDLLRAAGVDMASPQPVQDALDLFDTLLDEMEKLLEE